MFKFKYGVGFVLVALLFLFLSACQAEPKVVEVEKVVTQLVEVEKEVTKVVAGTPVVETVVQTQIVEKVVTATPEPALVEEEPKSITYVSMAPEGHPKAEYELWVYENDFKVRHPNWDIEFLYVGAQGFMPKVQALMAAGETPTLIFSGPETVHRLTDQLWPLNEALQGESWETGEVWKDTFMDRLWAGVTIDGNIFAIPHGPYETLIFYNKAQFAEWGLEEPKTWSEFIELCETIKGMGIAPLGLDNTEPDYNSYWWYWPVHRVVGHDAGYEALTTKGAPLDDPGWLEATKMTEELLDKGYFQEGFEGSVWPAAQMLFAQGKIAMMLMGGWLPGEVQDAIPDDWVWGSFPIPSVEGGKGEQDSLAVWANNLCIMKDGPNKEVAIEFLKAWSDASNMEEGMFGTAGFNTPIKGVSYPPAFEEPYRLLEETTHPVDPYFGLLYRETELYTMGFRPVIDKLFLGELRDEEFLQALAEARDNYMK